MCLFAASVIARLPRAIRDRGDDGGDGDEREEARGGGANRAAVERRGVGDLKGAAEVLALAETAPDVKGSTAYFGMNDGQGLRVVALCDPASKRPIVGGALSDVLRTVAETGGVPPRARGHVWRVMSLSKLREKAGGHTNALFYALHAFNPATAMGRKAHELLPKIHNFCVWRVLNPELDHNKRPERVYGVATRAQQRMMSAAVTLEAYLCVLADALQARDPGLLQTMILSIHNLIGFAEQNPSLFRGGGTESAWRPRSSRSTRPSSRRPWNAAHGERPRPGHRVDRGAQARGGEGGDRAARQRHGAPARLLRRDADRHAQRRRPAHADARRVAVLRARRVRLVGARADAGDGLRPHGRGVEDRARMARAYVLRMLTDAFAHLASKNIKATSETRSSTSSWRTRRATCARAARGVRGRAVVQVRARRLDRAYVKVATAVRTYDTVEKLVMALVPETALPDAQRAVRWRSPRSSTRTGRRRRRTPSTTSSTRVALLRAAGERACPGSAHLRAKAAERAKTLAESRSVLANAAVRLYHYERGGSLASAELVKLQLRGDPKYVRGVYTRMAHALVTGDWTLCGAASPTRARSRRARCVAPLRRSCAPKRRPPRWV